jgi:5-methylcytosine-specific restriction endonuclease McrA
MAVARFVQNLEDRNQFTEFTRHRAAFEEFLIGHKMYINQLTVKHGSMVKGYLPICEYYQFVFDCLRDGKDSKQIETELGSHEKFQILVKERPTPSRRAKEFTQDAKNVKLLQDVLATAFVCKHCGARIDKKSMHLDHTIDKSQGGTANIDNSQWAHPYCDSTFKYEPKVVT